MAQVKFLSGVKAALDQKKAEAQLVEGALYFCTDVKRLFRATAVDNYYAVDEQVIVVDQLPEVEFAIGEKLYLKSSDFTLHTFDTSNRVFVQLSGTASDGGGDLSRSDISSDLTAEDGALLISKAAVKDAVNSIKTDVASVKEEIGEKAKEVEVEDEVSQVPATGLYKEIDNEASRAKEAEAELRTDVDSLTAVIGNASVVDEENSVEATGLVKRIEDLEDVDLDINGKIQTNADAIAKLNADSTNEGSVDNKIKTQVLDTKGQANGLAQLDENGLIPVSNIPSSYKECKVVTDIAARDSIADIDLFEGLHVYVADASADATVDNGGAEYIYVSAEIVVTPADEEQSIEAVVTHWIKVAEAESMDAVLSWDNIYGRPTADVDLIDFAANNIGKPTEFDEDGQSVISEATGLFEKVEDLEKSVANEVTRATAAEEANAQEIATLNGNADVEGSIDNKIKTAIEQNSLQWESF